MLEDLNPWWFYDKWEEEDVNIQSWKSNEIKWIPGWIKEISLKPFSLNFVIGPRQVGKTTGIKFLIKEIIEKGENPRDIVYINCDFLNTTKDMHRILRKIYDKKFIILDEVTSLEYWWKPIKGFIDTGLLKNSVLIISGSSSIKLKKYSESFPGRKGKGREITVLPLSFPEFVRVMYGNARGIELEKALERYFELGGFPRSINRDKTFPEDFVKSVDREISKIERDYRIARLVIYSVLRKGSSACSYSSLGKDVELNHVIVREYLGLLEDLFILKVAFLKENKNILFKKEKKIFIRDPWVARIYARLYEIPLGKEVLLEWVVQEHLFRKFGEIYYYKNSYEIDCIAGKLKIEVKTKKPHRKYPKDVLILNEEEIPRFLVELLGK